MVAWPAVGLDLLYYRRLQIHRAETVDLAVNVVIAVVVNQPNIANFRANFDCGGSSLYLQVLHHRDGVTIVQYVS